jgi:hypothetical protein
MLTSWLQGDEFKRWDRTGLKTYTKGLWHRKKWCLIAQGAEFKNKVEAIVISFKAYQAVHLSEARQLVVLEIQHAVNILNSKQSARTIKKNGHFTAKNLGFTIGFFAPNGYLPKPYISMICLIDGILVYDVRNDNNSGFELFHEESFEDAVRIIEEESQHHNTTSEC